MVGSKSDTTDVIFLNKRHTAAVDDDYCFALSSGNNSRESIDGREADKR